MHFVIKEPRRDLQICIQHYVRLNSTGHTVLVVHYASIGCPACGTLSA